MAQMSRSGGAIKRRRVIQSCLYCREKKLKCDKVKPACSTCLKSGNSPCEYSPDQRLLSPSLSDELSPEIIDIHRGSKIIFKEGPLSFVAVINGDPFLRNLLYAMKDSSKVPAKIQQELKNDGAIERALPVPGTDLFENIKNVISDTKTVWYLVDHFFDSETFFSCSFLDKEAFCSSLVEYIGPRSYPAVRSKPVSPLDFIFLGTLLVILRISSYSFYNCGYPSIFDHRRIGCEVVQLALRCYETVKPQYHMHRLELLQLILMINYYQNHCPEDIDNMELHEAFGKALMAYKMAMGLGINLECAVEYQKRMWYYILDLDTTQFLRDGGSDYFIRDQCYTTRLPAEPCGATSYICERFKLRDYARSLATRLTDMRSDITVQMLESLMRPIEVYLETTDLDKILSNPNRAQKAAEFINYLELSSTVYMLTYQIFLYLVIRDGERGFAQILKLLNLSNPILQITHFLDSTKEHYYNLHEQFGYSFNLIPKILQTLHKFVQLQFSLIGRTSFLLTFPQDTQPMISEIRRIAFYNSRMLIQNFGKISHEYFYAKRMNRIQTVLFLNTFGSTPQSPTSQTYLNLLNHDCKTVDSKILQRLLDLKKSKEISAEPEEPFESVMDLVDGDLSNLLLDQDTIDELESLLNNNSFLSYN